VFASLKRAPLSVAEPVARLPGVAAVEPRVVVDVTLDLPASPNRRPGTSFRCRRTAGRRAQPGVSCAAAVCRSRTNAARSSSARRSRLANGLQPGDSLVAVINGRRETLNICGIGLSPEFVFEARAGETLPDHKRFSVMWMNYRALAVAYNMDGAFNDLCIDLAPGAARGTGDRGDRPPARALRRGGAYTRKDQASAQRLDDELRVLHSLSVAYPLVFLSVAAFMVNAVLARIVRLQREQIAQMKALGYSSRQVGVHYLKFVLVIGVLGTLIGGVAGRWMGGDWWTSTPLFFRFPRVGVRDGLQRARAGAAGQPRGLGAGRSVGRVAGGETAARRGDAAGAAGGFQALAVRAHRASPALQPGVPDGLAQHRAPAVAGGFHGGGLALATGLMVLPGAMSDSIDHLLTFQWNSVAAPGCRGVSHRTGVGAKVSTIWNTCPA
jgi:putative ABC transport system permease protein